MFLAYINDIFLAQNISESDQHGERIVVNSGAKTAAKMGGCIGGGGEENLLHSITIGGRDGITKSIACGIHVDGWSPW